MITTRSSFDQVVREIELSVQDAQGENPDVNPDDIFHDVALSLLLDASRSVATEVCRTNFGYVPEMIRRAWEAEDARRLAAGRARQRKRRIDAANARAKASVPPVRKPICPVCFTVPAPSGACNC